MKTCLKAGEPHWAASNVAEPPLCVMLAFAAQCEREMDKTQRALELLTRLRENADAGRIGFEVTAIHLGAQTRKG